MQFWRVVFNYSGELFRIDVMEVSSDERYKAIVPYLCSPSACVLLMADVSSPLSARRLADWRALATRDEPRACVVVAHKMDAAYTGLDDARPTALADIRAFANAGQHTLVECASSADGAFGHEEVLRAVVNAVASVIPNPPDPAQMLGTHVEVGPLILEDEGFRRALAEARV
jgi:hypothetical protein